MEQKQSLFDPNRGVQLLLELAHEQSLEPLLLKLINASSKDPSLVCVQIWLLEKGDLCPSCPYRSRCPDQSHCLHLHISRVHDDIKKNESLINDLNQRIPLGMGLLGKVAQNAQQQGVQNCHSSPELYEGFEWFEKLEGAPIRSMGSSPIVYRGEVLGAMVGFTRSGLIEAAKPWGRIFADFVGGAIANARAFEEIQRLKAQLELQNAYLREVVVETKAFGNLVGQSAALQRIVNQIDLVAPTEASVLILGETGTGKELVAYEIHNRSLRKQGPLVRVNCASIPKELFESEFFGHVKGAFTGALKDRPGRFETADGGTLFLDEIGEIPLEMQGKLLRVLQEKRYERVGDDHTRMANVRIIAATNRELKEAVDAGEFRQDLYYRINVFPIQVAPLRERKDDIPLLAKHFIDLSVKELRCPPPRLTRHSLSELLNYDWPGNIRELRNVVERAVILAQGNSLQFNLPAQKNHVQAEDSQFDLLKQNFPGEDFLTEAQMQEQQDENLRKVLEKTHWKIKGPDGAAELLGVKPTTLLSRIKKRNIRRD